MTTALVGRRLWKGKEMQFLALKPPFSREGSVTSQSFSLHIGSQGHLHLVLARLQAHESPLTTPRQLRPSLVRLPHASISPGCSRCPFPTSYKLL